MVLAHHGTKGMKWGVRKDASGSSSKPPVSTDHVVAEALRAKAKAGGVKALSNKELQDHITRMNLEQQHHSLTSKRPSSFDTGHNHVKKILQVGKTLNDVHNTLNGSAGKAAIKIAKTAYNAKKVAS